MNIGKVVGTNHAYIGNGIWIRCDCGSEMLEIIQTPDDTAPEEYQIRYFGEIGRHSFKHSENDIYYSTFWCFGDTIKEIVDYFEKEDDPSHSDEKDLVVQEGESGFYLICHKISDVNLCEILLQNKEKELVWDVIIRKEDMAIVLEELKIMLKHDKGVKND